MLVDTSVWIDHFRRGNATLREALEKEQVLCHDYVIGELACGNLRKRQEILDLLDGLPMLPVVPHEEVLAFVFHRKLMGRGLGWIDVHLLAAATLAKTPLFTLDRRLSDAIG